MEQFVEKFSNEGELLINQPLKQFTTWKVGGEASVVYFPHTIEQLQQAVQFLLTKKIQYRIIGRGSNMLIADHAYDGVIILLSKMEHKIVQKSETRFEVSAGFGMQQLSRYLAKNNYKGHAFFSGIPGSVGGGVFMNAGTPKGEMKDAVVQALVIDESGQLILLSNEDMAFSYRTSIFQTRRAVIIVSVDLYFEKEEIHEIGKSLTLIKDEKDARKAKQPINMPNGGSVFRNPNVGFAGSYVEQLGLKGFSIGGAQVSAMHGNFIVNIGGATASDILLVIRHIQKHVKETFDIELETEVELFNFKEDE